MRKLFLLAATIVIAVSFSGTLFGQNSDEKEYRTIVAEIVSLQKFDKTMLQMMRSQASIALDQSKKVQFEFIDRKKGITAAQKKRLKDDFEKTTAETSERMLTRIASAVDWNSFLNEVTYRVYSKHFTLTEVKDLLAFWKSPTGTKFLENSAVLWAESASIAGELLNPTIVKIALEMIEKK